MRFPSSSSWYPTVPLGAGLILWLMAGIVPPQPALANGLQRICLDHRFRSQGRSASERQVDRARCKAWLVAGACVLINKELTLRYQ